MKLPSNAQFVAWQRSTGTRKFRFSCFDAWPITASVAERHFWEWLPGTGRFTYNGWLTFYGKFIRYIYSSPMGLFGIGHQEDPFLHVCFEPAMLVGSKLSVIVHPSVGHIAEVHSGSKTPHPSLQGLLRQPFR